MVAVLGGSGTFKRWVQWKVVLLVGLLGSSPAIPWVLLKRLLQEEQACARPPSLCLLAGILWHMFLPSADKVAKGLLWGLCYAIWVLNLQNCQLNNNPPLFIISLCEIFHHSDEKLIQVSWNNSSNFILCWYCPHILCLILLVTEYLIHRVFANQSHGLVQ
jgi:hypothetical protein